MDIIKALNEKNGLKFSEQQLKILNFKYGAALVHATAGSGKTTTTCSRIGCLIMHYGVKPEKILTLTYSNASVRDIKERFDSLLSGKIHMLEREKAEFTTIHSFALSIVRYYFQKTNQHFDVIQDKGHSLLREIYNNIHKRYPNESEMVKITSAISYINNNKTNAAKSINVTGLTMVDGFSYIYQEYEKRKLEKNLIDYDDMISMAYRLLIENQALKERFENKYDFILVDEAQDMSLIQYELLRIVCSRKQNIMLIADDDQSIYGFRGSNPELLIRFTKDFLGVKQFYLDKNYRSTKTIVETSKSFIEKNKIRFKKEIVPNSNIEKEIYIGSFDDEPSQNNFIANEISKNYMNELKDTAILYRDNLSVIQIIYFLRKYKIPFYIKSDDLNFFYHFVKNDIIAAIFLAEDRRQLLAFYQIYNKVGSKLKRYDLAKIGNKDIMDENIFDILRSAGGLDNDQRAAISNLEKQLDELVKLKPIYAVDYFLNTMGYSNYLEGLTRSNNYENSIYARHVDLMKFFTQNEPSIRTYWDKIGRIQLDVKKSIENKGKDAVTLSTIHSAKGLEFKNVFLVELNEGIIPSYSSLKQNRNPRYDEYSEERRLMYVGLTRAKENLYLLSTRVKSRFLIELEDTIKNRTE